MPLAPRRPLTACRDVAVMRRLVRKDWGGGHPAPVLARSYAPATVSVRTIEAVVAVFASTVTR